MEFNCGPVGVQLWMCQYIKLGRRADSNDRTWHGACLCHTKLVVRGLSVGEKAVRIYAKDREGSCIYVRTYVLIRKYGHTKPDD